MPILLSDTLPVKNLTSQASSRARAAPFVFAEGPRERTPDGDLKDGWTYVDVWR